MHRANNHTHVAPVPYQIDRTILCPNCGRHLSQRGLGFYQRDSVTGYANAYCPCGTRVRLIERNGRLVVDHWEIATTKGREIYNNRPMGERTYWHSWGDPYKDLMEPRANVPYEGIESEIPDAENLMIGQWTKSKRGNPVGRLSNIKPNHSKSRTKRNVIKKR